MKKNVWLALCLAFCMVASFGLAEEEIVIDRYLSISLAGNPTTGNEWTYTMSDGDVLMELFSGYAADETSEGTAGAGGLYSYAFAGMKEGETTLDFAYAPVGDGNEPIDTYVVTLSVDADGSITVENVETTLEEALAPVVTTGPMGFALSLDVDVDAGYEWSCTNDNEEALVLVVDAYIKPVEGSPEGTLGQAYWMFASSGTATGDVTLTFTYASSEADAEPEQTLTYTFKVDVLGIVTFSGAEGSMEEIPEPVMLIL